jgi:hypothetical protein
LHGHHLVAHALHEVFAMLNTTPFTLESIAPELLLSVSGGCHQRQCCCPPAAPPVMQQIVQMPQPAPQILPQAAPSAPSAPSGDVVSTNVSINGQPVGG